MTALVSSEIDQFTINSLNINLMQYEHMQPPNSMHVQMRHNYKVHLPRELYNIISLTSLHIKDPNKIASSVINFKKLKLININGCCNLDDNIMKLYELDEYVFRAKYGSFSYKGKDNPHFKQCLEECVSCNRE